MTAQQSSLIRSRASCICHWLALNPPHSSILFAAITMTAMTHRSAIDADTPSPQLSSSSEPSEPATLSLLAELRAMAGINAARCYQCGKCTAGCPMADEMPYKIHQILRAVQLDRREQILADEAIWLCAGCATCTTRCPNQVEPARIIDSLRELALASAGARAPRRLGAFHETFLQQIERHGRVFEFGLVAAYKMRSRRLFDDVTVAPGMIARGKLGLLPHGIAGVDDVRRIFAACRATAEAR
jgi:heterodisulfide reductase subunit C